MKKQTFSQEDLALRMTYPGFVFRVLAKEGHDLQQLLGNTGLTRDALFDPEFQTQIPRLRRFILNAVDQTGEPHLGIRLAKQFEASFIGLPAYAAMNAATFEAALKVLNRFFHLAFPAIEFMFPAHDAKTRPGEFAIQLQPKIPLHEISYFASVSALVACDGLCKAILRTPQAALRGELSVSRPMGWADVEGQIGFPVVFEASAIRLFFADTLLPQPLPGEDPLNHPRLVALCEHVTQRAVAATTPVGKVTSFLQEGRNFALPISAVAEALRYSERGLRRHLERSGTTFLKLTNEIREQRARGMLANTGIPIKTIAHDLGFDTPSNFARSFKRWTGTSPSAFRHAANTEDGSGQN